MLTLRTYIVTYCTYVRTYACLLYSSRVIGLCQRVGLCAHVCLFMFVILPTPLLPSQLPHVPYPTVMSVLIIDNVLVGNQLLEVKTHLSYVRQVTCTPCIGVSVHAYIRTYIHTCLHTYEHVCTFGVLLYDCSGVCLCSLCTAEDELSPADRHGH